MPAVGLFTSPKVLFESQSRLLQQKLPIEHDNVLSLTEALLLL